MTALEPFVVPTDEKAVAEPPEHPDPLEREAISRVLAGDPEAFEPLVRRYLRPCFTIAFRLLGHREDAEDLVQESLLAALANLASFDPTRRFAPWLYRIVWNRALNLRKSRSRRWTENLEPEAPDRSAPSPAAEAERAALRAAVSRALDALPERQRLVVQLFDLDGFSGAEIAAMLDLQAGTVRWHLHQGRRALRERLAPFQEVTDEP